MFDNRRYRRYSLHNGRYLALPMEAVVAATFFTGALPAPLAVAYSLILGAWFVLG